MSLRHDTFFTCRTNQIRDNENGRPAGDPAAPTGESLTETICTSLAERLAALPDIDETAGHELTYDEHGLPERPEMDAYEATRRIRATPALAGVHIIAMTANAMAEDRRRCVEAGMDDFETKPIDPDHMYLTLAKWLPDRLAV